LEARYNEEAKKGFKQELFIMKHENITLVLIGS
jgi:hypothetical protein